MSAAGSAGCFHCGAPLRDPAPPGLVVDGARVTFCGAVCRDIAARIRDAGLTDFYRFRATPAGDARLGPGDGPRRWESFDRPAVQAEFVTTAPDGAREAQLLVHGVRCAACAWLIERVMAGVPGVRGVSVDPLTTRMRLAWDPARAQLSGLVARLAALGYEPAPYTDAETDRAARLERRRALPRLIVAGLGMSEVMSYATAMYAGALEDLDPAIGQFLRLVSLLVATPVVFYSGAPFFAGAWRGLAAGRAGMDVPVALAIGAAYFASVWNTFAGAGEVYFDSAVMFVFFLSCARFLEMAGRHRAASLTGALSRQLPRVALRIAQGRTEAVAVAELEAGDLVLVQPGQAIPADGVLEGEPAHVDESLLTGESRPVGKRAGETVLAGSVNLLGAARVRVRRTGADTVLAGIGRLVAVAREERPRLVEVTERVATWFVTGVLLLAATAGFAWWLVAPERAFDIVLAVLVVTCPCALALATPAAFTVGTAAAARRGVLLRRSGALETLSRVTDLVFDKTGTLTTHDAGILHVEPLGALPAGEALALAAALESHSAHPIARAFPPANAGRAVGDVVACPGRGLEGNVDGRRLRLGTAGWAAALAPGTLRAGAATPADPAVQSVFLGDAGGLLARFDLAEQVRPGVAAALAVLAAQGIRIAIASGDQRGPVAAVARRLGVGAWHAGMQPADKLALVRAMQREGRIVGVVGDGINDAPVLAGADVSIAIGNGSSLAQHAADCVLIAPSPGALPEALALARRTMRIVRQNLWWAAGYNAVAVPLAVAGVLAPWLAALGMSASSLAVTFNALRLGGPTRRAGAAPTLAGVQATEATP